MDRFAVDHVLRADRRLIERRDGPLPVDRLIEVGEDHLLGGRAGGDGREAHYWGGNDDQEDW